MLKPEYDGFALEDRIWLLPEVEQTGAVSSAGVDALPEGGRKGGLSRTRRRWTRPSRISWPANRFSAASAAEVRTAAEEIFALGALKSMLASAWVERNFEMGVVGFTLFFTFFNVVLQPPRVLPRPGPGRGIRSRKVLRTVFFLPNVLSMVVVALVWSFVFSHLLPALTGIDLWMGDPAKAPWLIVLVQVWQQAGYLMVIYLAGMSNIPSDVLEAASIDGASFRQQAAAHHASAPGARLHDQPVPEPVQLAEELRPGLRHGQGPSGYADGHGAVRDGHLLRRLRQEAGGARHGQGDPPVPADRAPHGHPAHHQEAEGGAAVSGARASGRRRPVAFARSLMIAAALACIYPALFVLNNAVKPEAEIKLHPISPPRRLNLANFAKAWTEMKFPLTLANTALVTVLGVAGILLVSSMAA